LVNVRWSNHDFEDQTWEHMLNIKEKKL